MSDDFKVIMRNLAVSIAKAALQESTPLPDRLDAFKALNAYYATLAKQRGRAGDDSEGDDPGGISLADLASRLNGAEVDSGAGSSVHGRARRHSRTNDH